MVIRNHRVFFPSIIVYNMRRVRVRVGLNLGLDRIERDARCRIVAGPTIINS